MRTLPTPEECATWTDEDYFAYDAVNASALKELVKSPKLYQHSLSVKKPPTINMVLGSAIHCLTFEASEFELRYAIWEGGSRRTKAYKEWASGVAAEGRAILTESEHMNALEVARAATRHPLLLELLGHPGTHVERVIVWDGLFGVCKAKLDLLHYSEEHGLIVGDLKTTGNALDEHSLTHLMGRYLVHLQLYHYWQAACALFGLPVNVMQNARLIALYAETSAPYDTVACELGPETIEQVKSLYYDLAETFHECQRLNSWPGYQRERLVEIPAYYTQQK